MNTRAAGLVASVVCLAAAVSACASAPTTGAGGSNGGPSASVASSPNAAGASPTWPGYGMPCMAPAVTPLAGGEPLAAQSPGSLPAMHAPFRDIGVKLGEDGFRDARIDVVANTASAAPADPSIAKEYSDALSAGTEPGLAARAVMTRSAPGVFSLGLGGLEKALNVGVPAGTPTTNTVTAPPGASAKVVAVPSPPVATSYTVYFVAHLDMSACNNGSPADGLDTEALATLVR
jgi:hypothetical protein